MASLQTDLCKLEHRNPAVQHCCQSRNRVLADCKGLQMSLYDSSRLADTAYLAALPELYSFNHILDYAACINHSVALHILDPGEANAMLATAKLALSALRAEKNANALDLKKEFRSAASPVPPQSSSQTAA